MKFRLDKSDVKSAVTRVKQEERNSSPHTEILRREETMAKMCFLSRCISAFYMAEDYCTTKIQYNY